MSNNQNNAIYEIVNQNDNSREQGQYSSCGSTCSSSCCDYSDSSIPEWDESVQENGELFYIKCSPIIQDLNLRDDTSLRSDTIRPKSNKFSTFLKKRKFKNRTKSVDVTKSKRNIDDGTNTDLKGNRSTIDGFEDISKQSAAVLFVNIATVQNAESNINENTKYYFPQTASENIINSIKGALLTLYHLLPKLVTEKPESSTIFVKDELVHLTYTGNENELLIVAFPEKKCSLFELKQWSRSIKRFLNFKYGSLYECFSNHSNHSNLNQIFGNLFIKLLKDSANDSSTRHHSGITENYLSSQLEDCFIYPYQLTVPITLETNIHEKLNEIEANDFGDLSEDHYGCQRLYTLIGTCLYYKGHLIITHLNREDQLDVHSFLRLNDTLDLTITSTIDSLIIWQEVFPSSCCSDLKNGSVVSNKRWFLLVIGKDQGLLVTLMESGGCSVSTLESVRPDELYVEQIQEAMTDILHCGLIDAVEQLTKYSNSNSQKSTPRKSTENLSSAHSNTGSFMRKLNDCDADSSLNYHSSLPLINGNLEAETFSESLSRTTSSVFSDESVPVLGRRAQRLKQLNNSGSIHSFSNCNLSDSDRSDYDTTSSSHSSSFTETSKKILKDSGSCKRIIHGDEKILFYYMNLYASRGVILYSVNAHHSDLYRRYPSIMINFKSAVQKIHEVLSQKKVSSLGKMHRNSVPVKEYGILFEYCDNEDDVKKSPSVVYWIVGRIFNKPHLGEIYVCYEDKTPQNLVEIAFRLAMST